MVGLTNYDLISNNTLTTEGHKKYNRTTSIRWFLIVPDIQLCGFFALLQNTTVLLRLKSDWKLKSLSKPNNKYIFYSRWRNINLISSFESNRTACKLDNTPELDDFTELYKRVGTMNNKMSDCLLPTALQDDAESRVLLLQRILCDL